MRPEAFNYNVSWSGEEEEGELKAINGTKIAREKNKHILRKVCSFFFKMTGIMCKNSYSNISSLNIGAAIICDP